jgi:hypothetical protein
MKTSIRHAATPQRRLRPRTNDRPKRPSSGQHPRRRFLGLAARAAAARCVVYRMGANLSGAAGALHRAGSARRLDGPGGTVYCRVHVAVV